MGRHFLVIGAQRCGTTYLRTLLDEHPAIVMAAPPVPEPKVFLSDEVVERGVDWYAATWFPGAAGRDDLVLGEKSTSYLECAEAAPRAAAVLAGAKILVQLRDPVARAVSNWQLSTQHGLESRDVVAALTANLAGPQAWDPERTSVSPYAYLERGRYVDYLAPWHEAFGDRVRILFLEDLRARPDEIGETYRWLGVSSEFRPPSLGEPVNQSSHRPPRLPPELEARLRDWYADSDRALADLLGRPVPWTTAAPNPEGAP
jgi:hypothetical protein